LNFEENFGGGNQERENKLDNDFVDKDKRIY
jgi:hypothetical protein